MQEMGTKVLRLLGQGVIQENQITLKLHHSSMYHVRETMGRKSRRTEAGIV